MRAFDMIKIPAKLRSTVIAAAILALPACAQIPTASEPAKAVAEEPYTGSYIRRPTLLVSDIEKSLTLYRDILGFRLGSLKQDPSDSYVYEAFNIPRDITVMHATLDSDLEKRTLSLVEVKHMKPLVARDGLRRNATLVNVSGRFDEIKSKLTAEGYQLLKSHPLGANGTEMGFIDTDGHLIVIYDFKR